MKKKLLKSIVYTAAAVLLGLSSLAGEQLRRGPGREESPKRRTKQ